MVGVAVRKVYNAYCRLITHFYLLKGEEPPVCIPCYEVLSVKHIFTGCVDLQEYKDSVGGFLGFFF